MNHYRFEDLAVGKQERFTVTLTGEMFEQFYAITGDENPLHRDRDFAKSRGFSDRVSYGMLTASFLSTLAGVYLPGEHSLIQSVEVKFVKPCFPGDTLTVTGTVTALFESVRTFQMKVEIFRGEEKVLKGKMQIGLTE